MRLRRHVLRRAFAFVRPHRATLAAALAASLLATAATALEPLLLKRLFDAIAHRLAWTSLAASVAVLIALGVAREALGALGNVLVWRARVGIHDDALDEVVGRLHVLPVAYHQKEPAAATMTRVEKAMHGFLEAFGQVAFHVLPSMLYIAMSVAIMVSLDLRLAALVLLFAPVPAIIAARSAPERVSRERSLLDRWSRTYGRFHEVLSGIVTVKSFSREEHEKHRFLGEIHAANRLVKRGVKVDSTVAALQNLVVVAARFAALGVGGYLVLRGDVTAGTLVAFLSYVGGLFAPVQSLSTVYKTLRTAGVSLDALLEVIDAHDEVADAPDAIEPPPLRGEVRFEDVRFEYDGGRSVLDGLDLHVKAGEKVAVVGPSGAGKTTMLALLQRLYDPSDGRVVIDGHDVKRIRQRSLRDQIGVVEEDPVLFDDTLETNLAYGRPDATREEVEAAVEAAQIGDIVEKLPQGYETRLGARGRRISAGDRQRVAIARALLKDPPILVLDDATKALDAESEHRAHRAIDRLVQGRTTFVVAHRLATVVSADRIVVLDDGRIAEQGTHRSLMRKGGRYAELVERQLGPLREAA